MVPEGNRAIKRIASLMGVRLGALISAAAKASKKASLSAGLF